VGGHVRIVGGDGTVLSDADFEARPLARRADAWFFGPDGPPSVAENDRGRGELAAREEVELARTLGRWLGCRRESAGLLLVCESARRLPGPDGAVVHVQKGAGRALHALYAVRFPLLKLTAYTLLVGGALGLWSGFRMVRPIERLRVHVRARQAGELLPAPLEAERDDEIGDLARAFEDMVGTLDARNRANAAFVADLAHELKNPVAAIRASAEVLEGRVVDPERAERLSRVLKDSSHRLDVVVTQFLDLARAEAGLPDRERLDVDLTALLEGLVETFRSDHRHVGITFELVRGPAPVIARGVPERLETVARNLLENAASFSAPAGRVRVEAIATADEAFLVVADTGPGIAPEDLPRVFDRFFSRRKEGTGLGLALVRAIAEAHGGAVEAHSELGRGSTFIVHLPQRA
jgi:two-component system sensor histidine kinase ChvG